MRDEFAVVNGSASAFFNQTGTFNVTNLDDKCESELLTGAINAAK